jgi:hypothetical protein
MSFFSSAIAMLTILEDHIHPAPFLQTKEKCLFIMSSSLACSNNAIASFEASHVPVQSSESQLLNDATDQIDQHVHDFRTTAEIQETSNANPGNSVLLSIEVCRKLAWFGI